MLIRYKAIREIVKLGPVASAFLTLLHTIMGVPKGVLRLFTITIEYDESDFKRKQ